MIHLILGGARSGKSRYAEEIARAFSSVSYVATALAFDEAMAHRIKHHQASRPDSWETIEKWQGFDQAFRSDCVLVDCLTLLISNHLLQAGDVENKNPDEISVIEKEVFATINQLLQAAEGKELVLVSNEVGLGLAPPSFLGNVFRDISGRVNQYLAQKADRVVFMVAGLPLQLKGDQ